MKKILLATFLLISIASHAQRMLVLPDTPTFANQNRGVWVFRIADNIPYYSNGTRWVANTGGLGPSTISDSLTAFVSRVVTSYNGNRGAVKGVDSLWFTNSGTTMHWRFNGLIYSQNIVGGAGVGAWGTITGTLSDQSDLQAALNLKLSLADTADMLNQYLRKIDTTAKWVSAVYRRSDSVFVAVGENEVYSFRDSSGGGVDSIWIADGGSDPDTLRYRALGTTYTVGVLTGGGDLTDGNKGDITVSGSGSVWTINNLAITNAKINDVAWSKITGAPAFITNIPTDSSLSISNRINLKLNISDTASMLANYVRQQRFLDSVNNRYSTVTAVDYNTIRFEKPNGDFDDINFESDTTTLASFGAGSGAAGDTAAFSTSAIYGSFYNGGPDTMFVTSYRIGLQGTSPSITATVYYNDSLNVTAGATQLVVGGTSATNIYTGTNATPTNQSIPPGNWVWVKTPTVTTKPTYFSLTLIGYKKK